MLAVGALALSGCSSTNSGPADEAVSTVSSGLSQSIDAAIADALQYSGSTSAIVGVWTKSGDYVHAYGDGVGVASSIRAAQASQPVMCALLLELVDDGKLTLNRELSKDLPRQVGIDGITYGELCSGHSGLANFTPAIADLTANIPTREWADRELLSHSLPHSPQAWPELNVYASDTNAMMLARAIRIKTGESLGDLLEKYVFEPSQMASTFYPNMADRTLPQGGMVGLTYQMDQRAPLCDTGVTKVTELSPTMLAGAGATVSTVTDLKRFYERYLDDSFGKKANVTVTDAQVLKNPKRDKEGNALPFDEDNPEPGPNDPAWGFGIEKVGPLFGRAGAMTGTLTAAYSDPASGLTIVVALNNSSAGASFVKTLAFELAALASESGAGGEMPWTAEDQATKLADQAICQVDPEAEAAAAE